MLRKVICEYLLKKAGPTLALRPGNYPIQPTSGREEKHKGFWKFLEEHRVELSDDESEAIEYYRMYGRAELNPYIRTGKTIDPEDIPKMEKHLHHLDKATSRSTLNKPVILWRGINFNSQEPITKKLLSLGILTTDEYTGNVFYDHMPTQAELKDLVGFRFTEPAFSSTTLSPLIFKVKCIRLRILLERGQQGLSLNSSYRFHKDKLDFKEGTESRYAKEHEVLLPRNTVFKVESVSFSHYDLVLTVRIID